MCVKVTFECHCGSEISDVVRGCGEVDARFVCDNCEAVHIVTITALN